MATKKGFDQYVVRINGGNDGRVGLVMCYSGNSFVGRIDFYPDGEALPKDYLWHPGSSGECVILHMPMSRFDSVLSTIREESPLNLYINANNGGGASTQGFGYLTTTDKEPVGEEEGTP